MARTVGVVFGPSVFFFFTSLPITSTTAVKYRNLSQLSKSFFILSSCLVSRCNACMRVAKWIIVMRKEPTKYIDKSPVSSFIMSPVEATEVCRLLQNLNENKNSLDWFQII